MFVGCLTSQQHASVSEGRICSDNLTCCHTEIEAADPTFYLTQSQHTDTGPTSPSADPITPGAWQGSHWSANFEVTGMTRPRKIPSQAGFEPWIFRSRGGCLGGGGGGGGRGVRVTLLFFFSACFLSFFVLFLFFFFFSCFRHAASNRLEVIIAPYWKQTPTHYFHSVLPFLSFSSYFLLSTF